MRANWIQFSVCVAALLAVAPVRGQSVDWQQVVFRDPQVRYLLADVCLGGNAGLYRKYAAEEKDPDSIEAIRLYDTGARVVNANAFERKWLANPNAKDGRVMRVVLRGTERTILGNEVLLTTDMGLQQAAVRTLLARLHLGEPVVNLQPKAKKDRNVAEALRVWELGARVVNLDAFELRGKDVVYTGTQLPIDGTRVVLTSDVPYPEVNVRYFMADMALGGSVEFYRKTAEIAHEMGCLEAVRRHDAGYKILNLEQFERKRVNGNVWITYKGTERKISGRDVKLSSD